MATDVWASNLEHEMNVFGTRIETYPLIAFDAEFPAFQRNRHMSAPENLRYEDLVFNVNNSKVIQLGFTLFNREGEKGGCWQINFSRKKNMINPERKGVGWVDPEDFIEIFNIILSRNRKRLEWITFHGIYDVAYLTKLLMKQDIPRSELLFISMVGEALGSALYDVKLLSGQSEYLGLQKLSEKLLVKRIGQAHQAGSDSLLTAEVFIKLTRKVGKSYLRKFEGHLFGISLKIEGQRADQHDAIQRREINYVQSIKEKGYPFFVDSQQFYGSQIYFPPLTGSCHQLMQLRQGYRVFNRNFYPLPTCIAMQDYRTPMFI